MSAPQLKKKDADESAKKKTLHDTAQTYLNKFYEVGWKPRLLVTRATHSLSRRHEAGGAVLVYCTSRTTPLLLDPGPQDHHGHSQVQQPQEGGAPEGETGDGCLGQAEHLALHGVKPV